MTREGHDDTLRNLATILRAKSFSKKIRKASLYTQWKSDFPDALIIKEKEGEHQQLLSANSSSKLESANESILSSGEHYEMQDLAGGKRLSVASVNNHSYISIKSEQRMMRGGPNPTFEYGSLRLNVGKRRRSRSRRRKCNDLVELKNIICGSWLNLLLFFAVPAWLAYSRQWKSGYVFLYNFLVIIPLASIMGDMTEAVAGHLGDTMGALLSATFGNAVEIILVIQAIRLREIRVVQSFLLGSILSNMMLVLGFAYIFSGKGTEFQTREAYAPAYMILVCAFILVITSVEAILMEAEFEEVKIFSRVGSLMLLFIYCAYLIVSLRAHSELFHSVAEKEQKEQQPSEDLSIGGSLGGMATTIVLVSIFSTFLISSIDDFACKRGISRTFIGLIILPIIGNSIEHWTAVTMAREGKMEVVVSIALGSTAQIGLLVVPVAVISGWIIHVPVIIAFTSLEIILFIFSIVVVMFLVVHGKANFISGLILLCLYGFLALAIWFENVTVASYGGNVVL